MAKKQIIKIDGMHCTSCSFMIDGDLEDTKGIISASTNYARQITEVEYEEGQINIYEILSIINKTGYKASL